MQPHITYTSEAYRTHAIMVYKVQTLANATWTNLKYIWSLNLNYLFKSTSINMWQIQPRSHQYNHGQHKHVFERCITFTLDCFVCSIDVQLESEATPFVEDPVIETSSARKAAPL